MASISGHRMDIIKFIISFNNKFFNVTLSSQQESCTTEHIT